MARPFFSWLTALCGAVVVVLAPDVALAQSAPAGESRVALVIGNSAYRHDPLKNPANDAEDMAQALRSLGFRVVLRKDASYRQMLAAVNDFGRELKKGGVGVFYFAGHGVQSKGRNYLIPVGAAVDSESHLEFETLDAYRVLAAMEEAGNRVNIVILDACRNNPYARAFRSATRGLAQMDAAKGSFVAFATAPGSVAMDGTRRNGVYTESLLASLRHPDTDIDKVFRRVTAEVSRSTGGKQVPWISSSLTADFVFRPRTPATTTSPSTSAAVVTNPEADERQFWDSVKNSQNPDELNAYLQQYPNGLFAPLARTRLASLASAPRPSATLAAPGAASDSRNQESTSPGVPSAKANESPSLFTAIGRLFQADGENTQGAAAAAVPRPAGEQGAPQRSDAARYVGLSELNEDTEFQIVRTLLPGDPGYFPKHPQWAEYVVKVKNVGRDPVRIDGVRLIDQSGVFVEAAKDATQLTVQPDASELASRQVGVTMASMLIPFAGFAAMAEQNAATDEMTLFAKSFKSRSLSATTIDTRSELSASVFLPLLRNPRAFVLDYETGSQKKNLRLVLPHGTR